MRIALVDDEKIFLEKEQHLIWNTFLEEKEQCILSVYYDGLDFLHDYEQEREFDLIMLDVEMPGKNGLEVARTVRKWNKDVYIVLITSHEQYAVLGYDYHICAYVEKTKCEEQLPTVCRKIIKDFKEKYEKYYYIQSELRYEKFLVDRILYLERENKYTVFYCQDEKIYKERAPLAVVYKKLDKESFAYINRGQIINMKYVTYLSREIVELDGKMSFSVSRNYIKNLRDQIGKYWSKYI